MSNKYPYRFEYSGPHIKVKLPKNLPLSKVDKKLIKQTSDEIISEYKYPYGLEMRSTVRANVNIIESTHPIVEKGGNYYVDM